MLLAAVAVLLLLGAGKAAAASRLAVLELSAPGLPGEVRLLLADQAREGALEALGPGFLVLTRENMAEVLQDSGMDIACATGECEVEIARSIGADYVVTGSVTMVEGLYFLNLKLHESAKGSLLASQTSKAEGSAALVELARLESMALLKPIAPPSRPLAGPSPGAAEEELEALSAELSSKLSGQQEAGEEERWGRPSSPPVWEQPVQEGGAPGSSFPLSCSPGEKRLAMVGKCSDGNFNGLAHYGWFYFARVERNFTGLYQFGVFRAYTGGDFNGFFQASLFPRVGGSLNGLQFGALNQVGETTTGGQVGLVNWTGDLEGVQLGLVNIDASGQPLLPLGDRGRITLFVNMDW